MDRQLPAEASTCRRQRVVPAVILPSPSPGCKPTPSSGLRMEVCSRTPAAPSMARTTKMNPGRCSWGILSPRRTTASERTCTGGAASPASRIPTTATHPSRSSTTSLVQKYYASSTWTTPMLWRVQLTARAEPPPSTARCCQRTSSVSWTTRRTPYLPQRGNSLPPIPPLERLTPHSRVKAMIKKAAPSWPRAPRAESRATTPSPPPCSVMAA